MTRRRRPTLPEVGDPRLTKALSHPLRVRILAVLDARKASPNELAKQLGATLGTVAYHVRTLEQLGMIELVDETRVRGAVEHHYRARERPPITAEQWTHAPAIAKQAVAGSTLQVIAQSAGASAGAGGFDDATAQMRHAAFLLDPEAIAELSEFVDFLYERAGVLERKSAERKPVDDQRRLVALDALLYLPPTD